MSRLISDGRFYQPAEDPKSHLYLKPLLEEYLKVGDSDANFFLSGPKGVGKTTLLRQKSYSYHNKSKGMKFYPSSGELVEDVSIRHFKTLSKTDLLKFKEKDLWNNIWDYILTVIVLKTSEIDLPQEVDEIIESHDALSVSSLLQDLLYDRKDISQYFDRLPLLSRQIHKIRSGVAVFIDTIDQAFEDLLKVQHYSDHLYDGKLKPSVELWINVQLCLLSRAYEMNRSNRQIKVFATFRSEAIETISDPREWNYRNSIIKINYEKEEIKELMEVKLKQMADKDIARANSKKYLDSFLGFSEIPHLKVKDRGSNDLRREKVFDYLYRHTYGRPREIVILLTELNDRGTSLNNYKDGTVEEKIGAVRKITNEVSQDFFKLYQTEIVPSFDKDEFMQFIGSLTTNYIRREEIEKFNLKTLKAYYSYGLLGFTKKTDGPDLLQCFLPPARYNYESSLDLPSSADYFLIHPTMNKAILDEKGINLHTNSENIIGDGYLFHPPVNEPSFYFPEKVQGNRWRTPSPAMKHDLALMKYYEHYFSSDNALVKSKIDKLPADFERAFNNIAGFYYCCLLNRKVDQNRYQSEAESFKKNLTSSFHINRSYQTYLSKKLENERTVLVFFNRLFGRLITLAAYIFLDGKIRQIHNLLTQGQLDCLLIHEPDDDNDFRYLKTAFFIEGLQDKDQGRDKDEVFKWLSPFEKRLLSEWRNQFYSNFLQHTWLDQEHRQWLEAHFKDKVWKT